MPLDHSDRKYIVCVQLVFPASLTSRQRAMVHAIGEAYGLPHSSSGNEDQRYITLGANDSRCITFESNKLAVSDDEIVHFIAEHLHLDAIELLEGRKIIEKGDHAPVKKQNQAKNRLGEPYEPNLGTGRYKPVDIHQFVTKMNELLDLERKAELVAAETTLNELSPEKAEARGRALYNLRLENAEGGLLGRTLLTLVRNKKGSMGEDILPDHKLSPHDIVRICPAKNEGDGSKSICSEGVVYRVKESSITIAVEEMPDEGLDVPLKLEKLANEVTYRRLATALRNLEDAGAVGPCPASGVIDVLFGRRPPRFSSSIPKWTPINQSLDQSQEKAVELALSALDIAIIHGPPGTGKTTALIEIIAQEILKGSRVLACAASNIAVDNLTERLATIKLPERKMEVVRVGHPARLLPQVIESSVEAKVLASDDSALAKDCRKEIKDINRRLMKLTRRDRVERQQLRRELRLLAKEEKQRQERALKNVLASANVVCATLTGVGVRHIADLPPFDLVVIDEAAQALEPACWAAILRGNRALLAGDHLQLPPTVTSEEAAQKGLLMTLFERTHSMYENEISTMLTQQYRMNKAIMSWSSNELYQGKLQAHHSVANHKLGDLFPCQEIQEDIPVLLLIDTTGCDMEEQAEEDGESRLNRGEASVTIKHLQKLLESGIKPQDIGIITPYSAQVSLLRELRSELNQPLVEISTVDGFQGREKEAIIICTVRSNEKREVGFLADSRRMNVAVTRARRHCALILDSETVSSDAFLGRLVTYFEEHGEYMSAAELIDL